MVISKIWARIFIRNPVKEYTKDKILGCEGGVEISKMAAGRLQRNLWWKVDRLLYNYVNFD